MSGTNYVGKNKSTFNGTSDMAIQGNNTVIVSFYEITASFCNIAKCYYVNFLLQMAFY